MSKKNKAELRIPLQVKPDEDTREKLQRVAQENALSLNDVATMCLAAGLNMVEVKLREIRTPEQKAA
jgi:hypothetical protein